jgi:hypothetical protein
MVNEKNKKIFLVVSQTGTILSRIVKYVTRDKYNHVSLSLKEDLSDLYSFGRKNPYNPFKAGFVKESPTTGTFGRFYKTVAVVLEVPVSEETFNAIEAELLDMYERRDEYHYNYAGLLIAFFGKLRVKKNTFYCSEFVQMLLKKYGLGLKKGEKELVCPNDFVNVPGGRIIYTGVLRGYSHEALAEADKQPEPTFETK